MDFDSAMKHVKEGCATQEEKDFVKAQIDELDMMVDAQTPPVYHDLAYKKSKNGVKDNLLKFLLIVACTCLSVIVAVGAVLGGVFGYATTSANKNERYSKNDCAQIARQTAYDYILSVVDVTNKHYSVFNNMDNYILDEIEKKFHVEKHNLNASYYTYKIEIDNGLCEFEIEVDSRTGSAKIHEVDGLARL